MNKAIPFVIGAAAGSVITWLVVKEHYKRIADEEIESVVQRFKNRIGSDRVMTDGLSEIIEPVEEVETVYEDTSNFTIGSEEYHNLLEENGYSDEPGDENYAVFIGGEDVVPPFVIPPEEYGDEGYETKSFKYYADSVLTDEEGEIVADPESVIGQALSKFGVYEEDSVYVRDIEAEIDYEILKDERAFADISGRIKDVDSYE
jgi:hypothetical protein